MMEKIKSIFSRKAERRFYFATDIHRSETCWRKFLNSGKHYEANVLVLGGDMMGKALVMYLGFRLLRRSQGINMNMVYDEIPED
jgi:Icc-related predicted phosphoesterase